MSNRKILSRKPDFTSVFFPLMTQNVPYSPGVLGVGSDVTAVISTVSSNSSTKRLIDEDEED